MLSNYQINFSTKFLFEIMKPAPTSKKIFNAASSYNSFPQS